MSAAVSSAYGVHNLLDRPVLYIYSGASEQRSGAAFVLYSEAVLWWEVQYTVSTVVISINAIARVLCIEVVLWWEGPL